MSTLWDESDIQKIRKQCGSTFTFMLYSYQDPAHLYRMRGIWMPTDATLHFHNEYTVAYRDSEGSFAKACELLTGGVERLIRDTFKTLKDPTRVQKMWVLVRQRVVGHRAF